ncbi:MAG: hypothetical protein GYA87_08155 [Christensenellaceae bacterium]|nr:hypothetical protein [Christensenellaceae bacterium]
MLELIFFGFAIYGIVNYLKSKQNKNIKEIQVQQKENKNDFNVEQKSKDNYQAKPLISAKCPACGAKLPMEMYTNYVSCEYCDTRVLVQGEYAPNKYETINAQSEKEKFLKEEIELKKQELERIKPKGKKKAKKGYYIASGFMFLIAVSETGPTQSVLFIFTVGLFLAGFYVNHKNKT